MIKENDTSCDIICEQLSNYISMNSGINVVPFLGIINYNDKNYLVVKKMIPIDWQNCILDANFYIDIKKNGVIL